MDIANSFDLTGKTAIITGASGGIGGGIALRFAGAGADVVVAYHTNHDAAAKVVERIKGMGRRAVAIRADATIKTDVERLVALCLDAFGRIDTLVNNAGSYPMEALLEMSEGNWDGVVNANLRSVFLCTQAVAAAMIGRETGGSIVNIASIEAENPAPMHAHYCAAKAAVVMLTQASASELGKHGIRVNCVSPGLIWREGIEDAWPEGVARWKSAAPLARLGTPKDIANACLFFASDAAEWITGANLRVDGGVMTNQIF